jgi:hypothetical protein
MIVDNIHERSQTHLGKLTPRARQDRFTSTFAIREGNAPSGWNTIGDCENGIPFGLNGEKSIRLQEYKDETTGKYNDVDYQGLKLREMVVERKWSDEKDRYEANLSRKITAQVERPQARSAGGVTIKSETTSHIEAAPEVTPELLDTAFDSTPANAEPAAVITAPGRPRGRPKQS